MLLTLTRQGQTEKIRANELYSTSGCYEVQ